MDPIRKAEKAAREENKRAAYQFEIAGLEFHEWPKIGRLNRDIVITEKIDGTNAAVGIQRIPLGAPYVGQDVPGYVVVEGDVFRVYAQSRTRIITPGDDNYGFASWVRRHAKVLVETLGEGLHFGEWWGVGIARGYDLSERRFSLFNTAKWGSEAGAGALTLARLEGVAIYTVPVLWSGPWCVQGVAGFVDDAVPVKEDGSPNWAEEEGNPRPRFMPNFQIEHLKRRGSVAAPGFMAPEGIVVYHRAANICMKATIEHDDEWKGKRS